MTYRFCGSYNAWYSSACPVIHISHEDVSVTTTITKRNKTNKKIKESLIKNVEKSLSGVLKTKPLFGLFLFYLLHFNVYLIASGNLTSALGRKVWCLLYLKNTTPQYA